MQPISITRSPILALRPVVSVSRTICLDANFYPLVGERVRALVLGVPGVPFHPVPPYLVPARGFVELFPEVDVLDRFLVRGEPAAPLPVVDPLGNPFLHVLGIRID